MREIEYRWRDILKELYRILGNSEEIINVREKTRVCVCVKKEYRKQNWREDIIGIEEKEKRRNDCVYSWDRTGIKTIYLKCKLEETMIYRILKRTKF